MPHGRSSADGDEFASSDEVKVYKDEGEDEKPSPENLSEEKFGLVTETEEVGLCDTLTLSFCCSLLLIFFSLDRLDPFCF